jgi:diacylglycerol kinase (ATP)
VKTIVFINPSSAGGKALEARQKIESCLSTAGLEYKIHITESLEDMIDTIKTHIPTDYKNFVGVGGDGTAHYMVNELADTDKTLGIIPMGSGNDIAMNLGIPLELEESCNVIARGKSKKLDLGIINDKYYYLCIAGSGFDSQVNDLANNTRFPIKGPSKYTYSVYKTLITFRSKKFTFSYDNQVKDMYGMMVAAANMPSYGGGMKISPDASPESGVFDVCIIKKMSKLHFVQVFPKVFEGKHVDDPNVEIFRTDQLSLESEYDFSVFADGEYICKLPAMFKMVPGKMDFLVP